MLVYVNYILKTAYYQPQHLFRGLETDCLEMTECPKIIYSYETYEFQFRKYSEGHTVQQKVQL